MAALPIAPLFALGFANPLLLWGLAAASVPILLHLLNRRRFREVRWAAMRFLTSAIKKNQRRIRIEQWLLLAIRTALILCLVLGLAQPFLESVGALPLLAGRRTHRVILLDASMSMSATRDGRTRFDRARESVGDYLSGIRRGDPVSLVLMGAPPRIVIGEPSADHEQVRIELEDLVPTDGGLTLGSTLRAVGEVFEASSVTRKELLVVSDLQSTSWVVSAESKEELTKFLSRLKESRIETIVVDVGHEIRSNMAVTDLRLDSPIVTAKGPAAILSGTIRDVGSTGVAGRRARLFLDNLQVGEEPIDLESGREAVVSFPVRFDRIGDHSLELRLEDDDLSPDNTRRLALSVRESVKVLLVDGDYRPEPFEAETDYLAQALAPSEGSDATPSTIRTEVITSAQLDGRNLSDFDVVVLCNVPEVNAAEASQLEAFLAQAGGLIVFGGDQLIADRYNELLFSDGRGMLPASYGVVMGGDPAVDQAGAAFDPLEFRHPLVAPYAGTPDLVLAGLTGVRTWKRHELILPELSPSTVALGFDDGRPAIVQGRRHRGLVLQVATSADADWTSWPLHPSYPPLIEAMALLAASSRQGERTVTAGQPLIAPLPRTALGSSVGVEMPDGELLPSVLRSEGDVAVFEFGETSAAGAYLARLGPPAATGLSFAVNAEPTESDPARLDESSLRQFFPEWDFALVDAEAARRDGDPGRAGRSGQIHRPILLAVLGLLLLETFVAWKLGSRR